MRAIARGHVGRIIRDHIYAWILTARMQASPHIISLTGKGKAKENATQRIPTSHDEPNHNTDAVRATLTGWHCRR